jgi:hypothetical protein
MCASKTNHLYPSPCLVNASELAFVGIVSGFRLTGSAAAHLVTTVLVVHLGVLGVCMIAGAILALTARAAMRRRQRETELVKRIHAERTMFADPDAELPYGAMRQIRDMFRYEKRTMCLLPVSVCVCSS